MTTLEQNIIDCLRMFGPCTVPTLQAKLFLRGIEASQLEILNRCEFLVNRKQLRTAEGFGKFNSAFKL